MVIKGKKLYLRTVREKDLDALYEFTCDIEARGQYYPIYFSSETAYKQRFGEDGFWGKDHGTLLICNLPDDDILGELYYF